MSSHQKTITVEHAGAHGATDEQIKAELAKSVKDEDYKLAGGYDVLGYENESGSRTKFTLRFDAEPKVEPAQKAEATPKVEKRA